MTVAIHEEFQMRWLPLVLVLVCGCTDSKPAVAPTREQLLQNAQECTEMIAELKSLSDNPGRETLRQIDEIEAQRDEYLRRANSQDAPE